MKNGFHYAKAFALLCTGLFSQNSFSQNTAWSTTSNIGIGTTTIPASPTKLNVTSGTAGISGLRFGNVTSATTALANSSGKLLTVNASGDIILANAITSIGLTMPSGFTVTGSPLTASGTLAVSTTLNGLIRGNGSGFVASTVATGDIANSAVTYGKIQNVTSGRILGRSTAGAGIAQEISLGIGLSLNGGVLSSTNAINYWTLSGANLYNNSGTNVGIGTSTPTAKLNVDGGNVLFVGNGVEGNKFLWSYAKSALRFGDNGSDWFDASMGGSSFAFGAGANATGAAAFAMGDFSIASGSYSAAFGTTTSASGLASLAGGNGTVASGINSVAFGEATGASGVNSFVSGSEAYASGYMSTAIGTGVSTSSYSSFAIGAYNKGGGNATTWVATDPLFEIGNGNVNTASNALTVFKNGKVAIGTTDLAKIGTYTLAVNGDAIFNRVRVKLYTSWPDYVFDKSYQLLPLSKLEEYIQKEKHLPGVTTATEAESEGIDMATTQKQLLQKIEELTLYLIQQGKTINALDNKIMNLEGTLKK